MVSFLDSAGTAVTASPFQESFIIDRAQTVRYVVVHNSGAVLDDTIIPILQKLD